MKRFLVVLFALVLAANAFAAPSFWDGLSCTNRRAIKLPSADINAHTIIRVPGDFSTGTHFVVDQNAAYGDVELDSLTNVGSDGNLYFQIPYPIVVGQAQAEREETYYDYYGCTGGSPKDLNVAEHQICSFEENPCNFVTGVVSSAVQLYGEVTLRGANVTETKPVPGLAGDFDRNYSVWLYTEDKTKLTGFTINKGAADVCTAGIYNSNLAHNSDGGWVNVSAASDDTWYYLTIRHQGGVDQCDYTFFDTSRNIIGTSTSTAIAATDDIDGMTIYYVDGGTGADYAYFDNFYSGIATVASGLGSEEESAQVFDVNIWRVGGYDVVEQVFPAFSSADGNLAIDFNVSNVDNNVMAIDINYSSSNLQGTGTVIVSDLNLSSDVCDDAQEWTTATDCSWDWDISSVPDGNYYILVDLNGGRGATVFDVTNNSLQIESPKLRVGVRDENTGVSLISVDVLFDGVAQTIDGNGIVLIDIGDLTGTKVLQVSEDNNYSARYFEFDVNAAMQIVDVNVFMLLDTNGGQNVDFKFYDSDQSTLLSNIRVRVLHDENFCSIRTTNAQGETTFFLNPDGNYVFEIVKASNDVVRFYPTKFTINIPKDEESKAHITPYEILGKQLSGIDLNVLSANIPMHILSNTVGFYEFDINGGALYYPRNYLVNTTGNPATLVLQPYLAKIANSGDFVFFVRNATSQQAIEGVRIEVSRNLSGEGEVEILSIETDGAGTATIPLLLNQRYDVEFFFEGVLVHSTIIRPTAAALSYQVQLPIGGTVVPTIENGQLSVVFSPNALFIQANSNYSVDINAAITLRNKVVSTITIRVFDTNGYLWDMNNFVAPWTDGNTVLLNIDLNAANRNFATQFALFVVIDVNSVDGNSYVVTSIQWTITREGQYLLPNLLAQFADLNNPAGSKLTTTFLALFFTLLAIGGLAAGNILPSDPIFLAILSIVMLFFFMAIGWIALMPFVFVVIFTVFFAILTRAVMG